MLTTASGARRVFGSTDRDLAELGYRVAIAIAPNAELGAANATPNDEPMRRVGKRVNLDVG